MWKVVDPAGGVAELVPAPLLFLDKPLADHLVRDQFDERRGNLVMPVPVTVV
jgi:hypothetical protein